MQLLAPPIENEDPAASFTIIDSPDSSLEDAKMLDIVFVIDSTGSMGSYIESSKRNIVNISQALQQSEKISPEDLRMCLIAYRDHPPQDKTYVFRRFPFTSDPLVIKDHLSDIRAAGGGDGPEAVTAAMDEALKLTWRPNAVKIVILIADAPPHGIGERDDGFPNGDPSGLDPLVIAHEMSQKGIVIYPVACEPTLSTSYTFATDFFRSLATITGGLMLPLTSATLLTQAIVGGAQEQLDLEKLVKELGQGAAKKVAAGQSEQEVTDEMYRELEDRGVQTRQLDVGDVYTKSEEAEYNVTVWTSASSLKEAKSKVKEVSAPRLKSGFTKFGSRRRFGVRTEMKSDYEDDDDVEESPTSSKKSQKVGVSRSSVSVEHAKRIVKQSVSRKWDE